MVKYRKRKIKKPKVEMKYVRVNAKTVIEVAADIPDEVAKENYLESLMESQPSKQKGFGRKK